MSADPLAVLWETLVYRVHDQPGGGVETLSPDERLYWVVSLLEGEVYNGGFHQYFTNSSGEHAQEALAGLRYLGATRSAEVLEAASRLFFPDGEVPKDRGDPVRDGAAVVWGEVASRQWWEDELEGLDRKFWADPDDLPGRLGRFAVERGLVEGDR